MTYQPNYDFLTLTQQAHIEAGEIRNALIDLVTEWTEKEIEAGNEDEMLFHRFLDEHPEWNHPDLHDLIESEMERVKLCLD